MNLQFDQSHVAMAQSFADKAKLWQNKPVGIESQETENDTLEIGAFCITKVMDTQRVNSILGEHTKDAIAYIVTAGMQEYDSEIGYHGDFVELAREWTLQKALRACAHAELDWALDAMAY